MGKNSLINRSKSNTPYGLIGSGQPVCWPRLRPKRLSVGYLHSNKRWYKWWYVMLVASQAPWQHGALISNCQIRLAWVITRLIRAAPALHSSCGVRQRTGVGSRVEWSSEFILSPFLPICRWQLQLLDQFLFNGGKPAVGFAVHSLKSRTTTII